MFRSIAMICRKWFIRNGFLDESEPQSARNIDDSLGRRGETAAAEFLQTQGYIILDQNFRLNWGELDLIAIDEKTVVYVEVKTLRSARGKPELAVNAKKREQLIKLAKIYASRRDLLHQKSRFDVIGINWPDPHLPPTIHHFKNAFRGPDIGTQGYTRWH